MPQTIFERLKKKYQRNKEDTGSPVVQIIVISEKIQDLSQHLKKHPHDIDGRLSLLKFLAKRRRLLAYLSKFETNVYKKVVKDLGLKA
ncbi:30S ribosomal protein S15 [bacterium]|nr:30S ribosomal protein S15 [bacterium]